MTAARVHTTHRRASGASRKRGRLLLGLLVGLATGFLGGGLGLTPLGNDFETHVGLTWLFGVRGPIEPPPEVAVVAINERAAERLGLPPLPRDWPRSIHSQLIERLVERGASCILFDLDFQRPKDAVQDRTFARAIAESDRVVLFERLNGRREPVFDAHGRRKATVWTEELVPPIPELANAAKGLAPFPLPKVQVNLFQFWAFKPSAGDVPTLPMAALQVHALSAYDNWLRVLEQAGADSSKLLPRSRRDIANATDLTEMMVRLRREFRRDPSLARRVSVSLQGAQDIPAGDRRLLEALNVLYAGDDNRFLNFYGPPGTIPNVPYNAVLEGGDATASLAPLNFQNKVVFVGFSDLYDHAQPDRFYTVFTRDDGVDLSAVEIAATAFANVLTDRSLRQSYGPVAVAILFALGLLLGSGVYLLTAWIAVPLALLGSALYVAGVQYAFNTLDLWFPLAIPVLVQLPLALFVGLLAQYFLERRRERRIRKAVRYYLPDHAARELTEKELDPSALNRVVYGICFATDMSGFTSISQSLDPSELAKFMNSYFDALAVVLKRHHVDVTEFHADTIMCAWTAEGPETLDRRGPTLAALATLEAVEDFNSRIQGVSLNARVGMDEGPFYLGHTGGGGRMVYSILGDCANTAARLESLNKHLRTHILASAQVVANVDHLLLRPVGQYVLVGRSGPLRVFEVVAERSHATAKQRALCDRFAEAFDTFRRKQLSQAARQFEALLKDFPNDGPTMFHLRRCQQYQAESAKIEDPSVVLMNVK